MRSALLCRVVWSNQLLHCRSFVSNISEARDKYDAVVIGAGHNGLVCAAYLQKAGKRVGVFERRHVVGGAAVTEEIVPGFKFSRASYVLSLLRPIIYNELNLKKFGLKIHFRNPSSYTPLLPEYCFPGGPTSLTLSNDPKYNYEQVARFSHRDAEKLEEFEYFLSKCVSAIEPLLDSPPPNIDGYSEGSLWRRILTLRKELAPLLYAGKVLGKDIAAFYELMTAPINKVLNSWFESEPLKATLGTDGLIGAMCGPNTPGTGYVLLHHVMGEIEGKKGAWGYPEGGMGAVSAAIAASARSLGADIFTEAEVNEIVVDDSGRARGVRLGCGREVQCDVVLSNATAHVTFLRLGLSDRLPVDYLTRIKELDYRSPVTKINVALKRLPNFTANPNVKESSPMPHHQCTIHLNCETSAFLEDAYLDAYLGRPSRRPMIEMVIPSSLDPTLAPPGHHVCLLFTQYTPYNPEDGPWDNVKKEQYADRVFNIVEEYAPGFKDSIVGKEVLTPPDLERIFNLTGGNIFHGSLSLDQLFFCRPSWTPAPPRTPIKGVYLCGSGAHPGGGVMGAPGRIAALQAVHDYS